VRKKPHVKSKSKNRSRKLFTRASRLSLDARLRRIKLLLTDVDGVMTDGSIFITADGEFKQFGIQDGLGLVLLRRCGIKVGWISARPSIITTKRAEELHIDFLSQDKVSKVAAAEKMIAACGLSWAEVCFVGDDVVEHVAGRCEVLMDGGVRRGTDIVKALVRGARAVLIGRPLIWGLAWDGAAGIETVLRILRDEFDTALALCGGTSVKDLPPGLIAA